MPPTGAIQSTLTTEEHQFAMDSRSITSMPHVSSNSTNVNDPEPAAMTKNRHDSSEAETEEPRSLYPTGIKLYLLAGASIAGVFLISLDQVCRNTLRSKSTSFPNSLGWAYGLTRREDYCRHSNTQDHHAVRRTQRRILVQRSLFHDFWWP